MEIKKLLKKNKVKTGLNKGFTFVEIIVVLGIFAAISSTVLFNFKDFSSGVSLQNLSQQIALQISSLQRKALSGAQPSGVFVGANGDRWLPSYGVCFTTDNTGCILPSGGPTSFVLFVDNGNNNHFDNNSERIDTIAITGGDRIVGICLENNQNCVEKPQAEIIFTRPNVSPMIVDTVGNSFEKAVITIESGTNNPLTRKIVIWKSGQVEIN